jgi:hypothetical protein
LATTYRQGEAWSVWVRRGEETRKKSGEGAKGRTHIVEVDGVTLSVRGETALGGDAETLESLLAGLVGTLGDEVRGLVDAGDESLLVLELSELRGDDTKNDDLVGGEVDEGL